MGAELLPNLRRIDLDMPNNPVNVVNRQKTRNAVNTIDISQVRGVIRPSNSKTILGTQINSPASIYQTNPCLNFCTTLSNIVTLFLVREILRREIANKTIIPTQRAETDCYRQNVCVGVNLV